MTASLPEMTSEFFSAILKLPAGEEKFLCLARGIDPYRDDEGNYKHRGWEERAFVWPTQAEAAVAWAQHWATTCDVYVCPYLMKTRERREGNAAWRQLVHCDVDLAEPDIAKARALGAIIIASGTRGHVHVYIPLAYAISAERHRVLCEGLRDYLGGDDKIRENDLLRVAGTFNLKAATSGGPLLFVMPDGDYEVTPVDPTALAAAIGVDIAAPATVQATTVQANGSAAPNLDHEEINLDDHPRVRDQLGVVTVPRDRSKDTHRIVCACIDSGLTLEQARWVISQRADLTERVAEFFARHPPRDDVRESWDRAHTEWQRAVGGGGAGAGAGGGAAAPAGGAAAPTEGFFSDARMAVYVADRIFAGRYIWVRGIGWLGWSGQVWADCGDGPPTEAIRAHVESRILYWARQLPDPAAQRGVDNWKRLAGRGRITSIRDLARNRVEINVAQLDSDPDLLNTPDGVVNLRTGTVEAHHQRFGMTKITKGSYKPGYRHPDVEMAMAALDPSEHQTLLNYIGQGITGHRAHEDITVLLHGEGGNGKSGLVGFGFMTAFGDYAHHASTKLFVVSEKGSDHTTEMADLRGRRFVLGEELQEEARLNIGAIKKLSTARITARKLYQDNIEFTPTHTLMLTSNPLPTVTETDDGTWRRLKRIEFPYRFVESAAHIETANDRVGDMLLRGRLERGETGQHDALLTLAIEGAMRWYANPRAAMTDTPKIAADTAWWREQNDRILRYWRECLVPDDTQCIQTSVMREHFTEWSRVDGHTSGLTRTTFNRKFLGHRETRRNRVVEKKDVRSENVTLSKPTYRAWGTQQSAPPKQVTVFTKVRFRTAADDLAASPRSGATGGFS